MLFGFTFAFVTAIGQKFKLFDDSPVRVQLKIPDWVFATSFLPRFEPHKKPELSGFDIFCETAFRASGSFICLAGLTGSINGLAEIGFKLIVSPEPVSATRKHFWCQKTPLFVVLTKFSLLFFRVAPCGPAR